MSEPSYQTITSFDNLVLNSPLVVDSHLKTGSPSSPATLTIPYRDGGTLALTSDISTATANMVTLTGNQILTHKTLTEPIIGVIKNGESGSEASITVPSTAGTLALTSDIYTATTGMVTLTGTQTLTNKTLTQPIIGVIKNGESGSEVSINVPSAAGTLALTSDVTSATSGMVTLSGTQTLTNKTLTEPIIGVIKNGLSGSEVSITVPSTAGTLALTSDVTSAQSTLSSSVTALSTKLDRLLTYLENWASVGNLSMSNVRTFVNSSTATFNSVSP